jgi:hypothetical protein
MDRFHGLHPDFKPATWRGTCASDGEYVGISFDLEDGSGVVRLAVKADGAKHCAENILHYLAAAASRTNSQSDSSSGNPSVDVSVQLVGVN